MTRTNSLATPSVWLAALLLTSPAFGQGRDLLVVPPSLGQDRSEVRDDAAMFSKEAIRKAQLDLAEIDRNYRVAVTVETIESLRGQTIDEVTRRRAEQLDHKGVFVLIAVKDRKAEAIATREVREKLGQERLVVIREAFTDQFRVGKPDEGLIRGVQAAASALRSAYPEARAAGQPGSSYDVGTPSRSSPKLSDLGDSPLVARQQVRLTLAGARKVLEGAEAKAASLGQMSNIAVVDDGGHLLAFARMEGARPASVATSITKATSAATFRQASGPLPGGSMPEVLLNLGLQDASGGKITPLRGGLPIAVDGQIIGAVGVGGGTGEQDAEVAKGGVDAFLAGLREATKPGDARPGDAKPGENRPPSSGAAPNSDPSKGASAPVGDAKPGDPK